MGDESADYWFAAEDRDFHTRELSESIAWAAAGAACRAPTVESAVKAFGVRVCRHS